MCSWHHEVNGYFDQLPATYTWLESMYVCSSVTANTVTPTTGLSHWKHLRAGMACKQHGSKTAMASGCKGSSIPSSVVKNGIPEKVATLSRNHFNPVQQYSNSSTAELTLHLQVLDCINTLGGSGAS